jgi:hypothetical protein
MRLAKLIEEHGADMPGPQLAVLLAKDLPEGERALGRALLGLLPAVGRAVHERRP